MFNILFLFVIIPVLTLGALFLTRNVKQVRAVAATGASLLLIAAAYLCYEFVGARAANPDAPMLFTDSYMWFEPLNIHLAVGVDGISVLMIMLSAIIVFTGTFASWKIEPLTKEYFLWFILLSTGVFGFFISIDLFTMFMFYEVALIPMYLLIGVWGSGNKNYAAMKLTLMLMGGSALLLISILGIYYHAGHTMNLVEIAQHGVDLDWQNALFVCAFVGFGVLGAIFPFHTWSPGWIFMILTGISVVYGAFAACVKTDLKYINAYSSVSHCGLVLFAILMLNQTAMSGAVMQMLSHGLMTALFFALIGMIYGRTHTRDVREMGGLMQIMPFLSVGYIIAGLASLGLPGLSGFVAEMTIFFGSFENTTIYNAVLGDGNLFRHTFAIVTTTSIVITAVYILRVVGKLLFGKVQNEHHRELDDAHWYERFSTVTLMLAIAAIGCFPDMANLILRDSFGPIVEHIMTYAQ